MKLPKNVLRTVIAGIGLALVASVSQAATIAINPTADSAAPGGTVNYSFQGSDFTMGEGAFDLIYDPNVLTYNGDFAFDAALGNEVFFDTIDFQAPGLLSIGWTNGFGPAIVFPASPGTKTIGSLSFTINPLANAGDFSTLSMTDSAVWGSFADEVGAPIAMQYVGGLATTVVPVPAAVWLFGSGLLGLVGIARRGKQHA